MGKTFCKVDQKWCKYLKRSVCTYCGDNIETVNRCPRLKEIETKRLSDILKEVTFDSVFDALSKWYPNQVNSRDGYENVFYNIVSIKPKKHNLSDLLIVVDVEKDGDNEYLDTYGISLFRNIRYGLEFSPWSDWVSMFIGRETLNRLNNEDIVAACLYEMTYFGFEERSIKHTKEKMMNSIEECKAAAKQ